MLLSKIQMTLWEDRDIRNIFERVIIKSMLILSFKDSYNRTCCNGAFPDGTNNGLLFSLTTSTCIWRIGYIYIYPNISSCFRCKKKKNPLRRSNNNKQRFRVANLFSFQNFWTSCKKKVNVRLVYDLIDCRFWEQMHLAPRNYVRTQVNINSDY